MLFQYIVAFIVLNCVNGDNTKGSLTFVIDDTPSMTDDIEQVKEHTGQVFDAVLSSNASKIDDFIIVTFNDPEARLYTVTRDRDVFKKALAELNVRTLNKYGCPEYAMKGIELALENSKPNSFFYVFTDAAAKDYKEYDRIKSLGLKKSIQVTFLLTGECRGAPWEANAVYDKLAAATNGQVFHLDVQDIQKIMGYIIASVSYIKTTLAYKNFDNALNKKIQFSIDSKVWDVIISVSGISPRYHITGPDGNKIEMKTFIDTEKSHISKLEAKPGVYTVHLDSEGAISTVITGSTSVSFHHGFAIVQPNTLNETSTRPISGLPSYLSIALDNIDKDVSLDTIEIRDIKDNFISEFPLTLIDKNQQFYVTTPLMTPNFTFKLAISGHTKTKEKITRVASTTIEPQKPELEEPKPKAPTVTILEGAKIIGEYDTDLTLKCKVNGFPKPDVVWQDNLETVYLSTIVPVDLPYEYMSILKIDKINKNVTIQCKAVNFMGEKSEYIKVETKKNYFIKVLAFPKDTTLEYGAQAKINFRVKSFPQVKITWYINDQQIKNNTDYEVSSDGLRIRQMRQELKGNYTVEAFNDKERKKYHFKIDISGVIPVIDKSTSNYKAEKGSNVNISCRILKSQPSPVTSWTFKPEGLESSIRLKEVTETLHLKNVGLKQIGTYTCLAHNEFGRDSHVVDLFVEYPPVIDKVETQVKIPKGELINLYCKVDGSPFPLVRWLFNKVEINNTGKYIYNDSSLSFTGSIEDNGIYTCEAINSLGKAEKAFYVTIFIIPVINKSISDYKAERGSNVNISCRILKSQPSPVTSWTFKPEGLESSIRLKEVTETLHLKNVGLKQIGTYTCLAHNEFGRDSHVVDLFVEYPPVIDKVETQVKIPKGELINLYCKVDGSPFPLVRWLFNKVEINNTGKYIYNDSSLSFTGSIEDNGIYTCEAINSLGKAEKAFHVTIFIIPVINKSISDYKAERGSNVNISCRILKSQPSPVISWTFKPGGLEISIRLKEVTETLQLKNVGLKQIGTYTCLAHNEFGRDSHVVDLFVEYAPTIQKVKTQVKIRKGKLVILTCKVEGSPFPTVRWLFKKVEINNTGKYIFNTNSLRFIGSIEDNGIYTCEAINSLGKAVKAFYVTVFIIPVIDKSISDYKAERGSNVNISCRILKSKPTPVISWTFKPEGFETSIRLKEVTETLHLKNVSLKQIGTYTCLAHNKFGRDTHVVDLFVEYAPTIEKVKTHVKILKGQLVILTCKVDGSPFPTVRWSFNKVEINNTGKYIYNANSLSFTSSIEDNGIYTCEAINSLGKNEKKFYVTIFIPIKMKIPKQKNFNLDVGDSVSLSCYEEGYPKPEIRWTFYSKNPSIRPKLLRADSNGTISVKNIQIADEGFYSCFASNVSGLNRVTYEINVKECLLDIEKDFNKHQPLLLSQSRQWPDLKKLKNFVHIPKSTHFLLSCPGNTVIYNEQEFGEYVKTLCIDHSTFKIRDRIVDFSKIKCKKEIKPLAKRTNLSCFSGNTDLLRVGFSLKTSFLGVYDVCIDKDKKIPLFTRHNLHQGISGTLPKENFKFTGSKYLPFNFKDMYKCWYQLYSINLMTGNNLSSAKKCCFKKRQLVSPADVIPGLSQVATYNYLNVIPQWSSCGTENWDQIELLIQSLAMVPDINLSVFTGSSHPLTLPGQAGDSAVFLRDRFINLQRVPMYIWKVVQNTHDKSSLAIVQLNIPNIILSEALSYMPCEDICDEVEWLKNYHWHDVDKGFTFCCSITEFASYYGTLFKGHDKVFKTIPVVSDHSLI